MADPLSNKMLNRSEKLDARGDAILDGTLRPQRGLIGDAAKGWMFPVLDLDPVIAPAAALGALAMLGRNRPGPTLNRPGTFSGSVGMPQQRK
jgi:hypothetical protein